MTVPANVPSTLLVHLSDRQAHNLDLPPGSTAYIKAYDVNGHDGMGEAQLTLDIKEAVVWPSPFAALEAWREQSTVAPIRLDGKPNRPLTAYTVELLKL